jgi:hypothetical protein
VAPGHDLNLKSPEKLETLRRLDRFRHWHSLEEKRYCLCCDKIIRGEEIRVVGEGDEPESRRLMCPTAGCSSIPMDWALPPNETVARVTHYVGEPVAAAALGPKRAAAPARMDGSWRRLAKRLFRAHPRSSTKTCK